VTALWVAASIAAVSAVSLVGVAVLVRHGRPGRISSAFVGFAVGGLLGDAFIHLIPEAFGRATGRGERLASSLLLLGGMLLFFAVERWLRGRGGAGGRSLAAINVLGDAIHNFIDGVLIAVAYLASPALGLATTLAVVLHEIPQELGDFGVLLHAGVGPRRAVLLNLASAGTAAAGAALALLIGAVADEAVTRLLLPVAAGGFVYIAAADLIPELHLDRGHRHLGVDVAMIAAGVAVMALLLLVE
jgi:zinc and cadmium transporter